MKRPCLIVLISILTVSIMPGCWDRAELEDVAWIQSMGFDIGPEGYLECTVQIGIPRAFAGLGGGGVADPEQTHVTVSVLARTPLEAFDLVSTNLGRRISFEHTQVYVFGEDLARNGITPLVQAMDRFTEIRSTSFVAVARGRAADLLRTLHSPLDASASRFIGTVMEQQMRTGLFDAVRLGDFVRVLNSEDRSPTCPIIALAREYKVQGQQQPGQGGGQKSGQDGQGQPEKPFKKTPKVGEEMKDPVVPPGFEEPQKTTSMLEAGQVPRMGGGPVELLGTAVFRQGKMVGTLNGEETKGLLLVRGEFRKGSFSVPDPQAADMPQYALSVDLRSKKRTIKATRTGDQVSLDVYLELNVAYMSMKAQTDYTDPRNSPLAEQAAADYVKKHLDLAIQRTQKHMEADPFGFGNWVKRTFRTWPEWEAFAWQSKYPDAAIRTRVKVNMVAFGQNLGPFHIPSSDKMGLR